MYVYHLVPKGFVGEVLYPLNGLKSILPEAYATQVAKYVGREAILERRLPKLDCLWNDVLHCSSIDPQILFSHLELLGLGKFNGARWFKIPVAKLAEIPTAIYRAPSAPRPNFNLVDDDIDLMNASTWIEPTELSAESLAYFEECKAGTKPLFAFQFVPHVLVRGNIPTEDLEIVTYATWSEA